MKDAVLEKRLGDVVDVQSGFAFKSSEYSDSGHFLIRIANVQDGYLSLEKPKYVALNAKTKRFELRAGDILTSLTGNVGRVAKVEPEHLPAALNQRVARLVPKPDAGIDAQYLLRFLHSSAFSGFLEERAHGAAQANVSPSVIGEIPIPLPPLEEQQRIVAVLDETFEGLARARAHAEANLQNARELFAAELFQVFENELPATSDKTFEEITSESLIGLVRSKKEQGLDRQYDYVKMQNIGNDDRYLGAVVDRVDCSPSEEARFRLERGDLLFNTRNSRELVGKSCVIEQDFDRPTVFNNNIMRVRFFSEIYPRYVALAFRSGPVKEQLEAMKSGTTSVVAIYHKSLKKLRLPVPEYAKQRTLVERFDELDGAVQRVIQSYEMQIKDIDDLRQSLLQKAFAGELT